ncbi:mandelamide amidase [Rhizobiales bacterium GAS113]|nr:mandelamide amidase [Rhizobiales bacterium GAS113]
MAELSELGVREAARAIRDGDITVEALADCLIGRAIRFRDLNAFISFDAEAVREAARGADQMRARGDTLGLLHGVPLSLKDNINTASLPTTAGTPALRDNRPSEDAPVAAALFGAGAILFGKNTMHELAFGITCNNPAFGAVRNPYNIGMIPGGSSGGTAAAVAARLSPAGIGSDTGGSVRVPAALCGVAGLRPTLKRWPQKGIVPIASTRDTAGPIARSVGDLGLIDALVTGDDEPIVPCKLRGLRLGLPPAYFWECLDDETASICAEAVKALKQAGAVVIEAGIENIAALNGAVSFVVALYEPRADIRAYLRQSNAKVTFEELITKVSSPDVRATMESMVNPDQSVPEDIYARAINYHRPELIRTYSSYFAQNTLDAVIFPTTPLPARPIGDDDTVALRGMRVPTFATFIRNTDPGSNAGFPGVTIPVGLTSEGLPVGIALDGPPRTDRRLLSIAGAFEEILPQMVAPRLGGAHC